MFILRTVLMLHFHTVDLHDFNHSNIYMYMWRFLRYLLMNDYAFVILEAIFLIFFIYYATKPVSSASSFNSDEEGRNNLAGLHFIIHCSPFYTHFIDSCCCEHSGEENKTMTRTKMLFSLS